MDDIEPTSLEPADPVPADPRIPVHVITGFLGAGKTTMLNSLLASEQAGRTGVLLNEVGDIDIERHLVRQTAPDSPIRELANGCLCCAVDRDVESALWDLLTTLRSRVQQPRIVVETSGVADALEVLRVINTSARIENEARQGAVVCLVACDAGEESLARFPEARRQVACADLVVLTKKDLADPSPSLLRSLRELGHTRTITRQTAIATLGEDVSPLRTCVSSLQEFEHTPSIRTVAFDVEKPVSPVEFSLCLGSCIRALGGRLLRLKAVVEFTDRPGQPAIIQGVMDTIALPVWLAGWPRAMQRGRVVLITDGVRPSEIAVHFPAESFQLVRSQRPTGRGVALPV